MNEKRRLKYARRLMKKDSRERFVVNHLKNTLAFQIREMRDNRGLSQSALASKLGTQQAAVSRLEDPDYASYNINTLIALANCFDVGLQVHFVPFSRLVDDVCEMTPETLNVTPYDRDSVLMDSCSTVANPSPTLQLRARDSAQFAFSSNEWSGSEVVSTSQPVYRAH